MENQIIESFDKTKLYCYLWDDVENPKAVVLIIHGMGEHAGRYGHFAKFLNEHGYIAFGDDHRGHGLTETDENRGHHDGDMFKDTVRDEVFLYEMLKEKYKLPVLVLGHSYGSFLGQSFLQQGTDCKGVALTGSGVMSNLTTGAGIFFASQLQFIKKDMRMEILNHISDPIYAAKYKSNEPKLWLTRDPEYREISINDPMSGVAMSVSFCNSMLKGVRAAGKDENLKKLQPDTPIGIFSGSMDPIGGYGKGIPKLKARYEKYGVKHLAYHIYDDAHHEVLNETNRDEVMRDILQFFDFCVDLAEKKEV